MASKALPLRDLFQIFRELIRVKVLIAMGVAWGLLAVIWLRTKAHIFEALEDTLSYRLQLNLEWSVDKVNSWFALQSLSAGKLVELGTPERQVAELSKLDVQHEGGASKRILRAAPEQRELRARLLPMLREYEFSNYYVVTRTRRVLAAPNDSSVGGYLSPGFKQALDEGFKHERFSPMTLTNLEREEGDLLTGPDAGTSFIFGAPIFDQESFELIAMLLVESRAEKHLGGFLKAQELPGNWIAVFDGTGRVISEAEKPPMGQLLNESRAGINTEGYRSHRGGSVVGKWSWLPSHEIGVLSEIDRAEAFKSVSIIERSFRLLYGLLVLSALGFMLISYMLIVFRRRAEAALLKARQVGQYTLEGRIGKGGMGEVYKGRHSMLRRPTAIKLIHSKRASEKIISQFEREVQLTSQLTHPNTIAIYDYGRTPDNIFYYAMEYLNGFTLKEVVAFNGVQPEGRVIHILMCLCSSLHEAHGIGLIHRDIKPANIMLCHLGAMYDVVKLLDFGLVKDLRDDDAQQENLFAGSLRFMAPEAVTAPQTVDNRADVYSLGALAYYMLTGSYVYEAATSIEYHSKLAANSARKAPSVRTGNEISSDLESIVMECLEYDRDKRISTVLALSQRLSACQRARDWTGRVARSWWMEHAEELKKQHATRERDASDPGNQSFMVDLAERK